MANAFPPNAANASPPNVANVNILTPTGSNTGSFDWNKKDKELIQKYREYYYEMVLIVENLDDNGPDNIILPKKTNSALRNSFGNENRRDNTIRRRIE